MPPTPLSKAETIQAIQTTRQQLEAEINSLTPAQLITPGSVTELWSGKDLLAHIASWEQVFLNRLQIIQQGQPAPSIMLPGESFAQAIQRHNDTSYLDYKDYGLLELQGLFAESHEQLLIAVADLREEDLTDASELNQLLGVPVWGLLRGVSYHHYGFHADDLRKYLAR